MKGRNLGSRDCMLQWRNDCGSYGGLHKNKFVRNSFCSFSAETCGRMGM